MKWHFYEDKPIYSQIIAQIKQFIVSGKLNAGEKLPSVRELSLEAKVNPNTMQRALSELEGTGLLHSVRTTGRFVTKDEELIQSLKDETAKKEIRQFFHNMSLIGYNSEQAKKFISNYKEEDSN